MVGGRALGRDASVADLARARSVAVVDDDAAVDALVGVAATVGAQPLAGGEDAQVLLLAEDGQRRFLERGADDALDERLGDRLGGGLVHRTVQGDDATEGRERVGRARVPERRLEIVGDGHAAGVGVLHDDRSGPLAELPNRVEGRVDVDDVVEAQLLAARAEGLREGEGALRRAPLDVERALLMRVLAVAAVVGLVEGHAERAGERLTAPVLADGGEVADDGSIVSGGVAEGLRRQARPHLLVRAAAVDGLEDGAVIGGVDDDGHPGVVLRGGAHHRRPADVDVLDDQLVAGVGLRHRLLEGVEVDDHQIDGGAADRAEGLAVGVAVAHQDPAVHPRVQRLDAPVHDLGEAGVVRDVAHLHAGLADRARGAPSGQDLHLPLGEPLGELDHTGLVGNRNQSASDVGHVRDPLVEVRRSGSAAPQPSQRPSPDGVTCFTSSSRV